MQRSSLGFAATVVLASLACVATPSSGQQISSIGYPSVAEALSALKARPDVEISEQGGWTIVNDRPNLTVWSFTPAGHPAHPTAVKRTFIQEGKAWMVQMNALCQSDKAACDELVAEFHALNERMRQDIERTAPRRAP